MGHVENTEGAPAPRYMFTRPIHMSNQKDCFWLQVTDKPVTVV